MNLCTIANLHYARLWNRELAIRPKIPDKRHHPNWHQPTSIDNTRVFAVLTLSRFLLQEIAPQSEWCDRLFALLDKYPDIPLIAMGFPTRWKELPIWRRTL